MLPQQGVHMSLIGFDFHRHPVVAFGGTYRTILFRMTASCCELPSPITATTFTVYLLLSNCSTALISPSSASKTKSSPCTSMRPSSRQSETLQGWTVQACNRAGPMSLCSLPATSSERPACHAWNSKEDPTKPFCFMGSSSGNSA